MKDLITVFAFCPDDRRKIILQDFLFSIQSLRDSYDILVVSHSEISDISHRLCDFFYLDNNNKLLTDFDLTNKFWFRSGNLNVNSSLVYPYSTHLAIYRLLYYAINFCKFMGYQKVHFIEYDIDLENIDLINQVNRQLDLHDAVMFNSKDKWTMGVYFASNMKKFETQEFIYDEEKILKMLKGVENRMTEYVTPLLLSQNGRKIFYDNIEKVNSKLKYQKNDEHLNYTLTWCVPLANRNKDEICFFIFNEKGWSHKVDLIVDSKKISLTASEQGRWSLLHIGNFSQIQKIEIFVDKVRRNTIILDDSNREKFKQNNYFEFEIES